MSDETKTAIAVAATGVANGADWAIRERASDRLANAINAHIVDVLSGLRWHSRPWCNLRGPLLDVHSCGCNAPVDETVSPNADILVRHKAKILAEAKRACETMIVEAMGARVLDETPKTAHPTDLRYLTPQVVHVLPGEPDEERVFTFQGPGNMIRSRVYVRKDVHESEVLRALRHGEETGKPAAAAPPTDAEVAAPPKPLLCPRTPNVSEAPERASLYYGRGELGIIRGATPPSFVVPVDYVRADLFDAEVAKVAQLEKEAEVLKADLGAAHASLDSERTKTARLEKELADQRRQADHWRTAHERLYARSLDILDLRRLAWRWIEYGASRVQELETREAKAWDAAEAERLERIDASDKLRAEAAELRRQVDHYKASDEGKYFVKARVYGAIAAEYQKALQAFADRGEALAQAALDWRYSEKNGVPMSAVAEIGELLDAVRQRDAARARVAALESQLADTTAILDILDPPEQMREHIDMHPVVAKALEHVRAFRAGSSPVHAAAEAEKPRCKDCGGDGYYKGPRLGDEPCPTCRGTGGVAPPDVVARDPISLAWHYADGRWHCDWCGHWEYSHTSIQQHRCGARVQQKAKEPDSPLPFDAEDARLAGVSCDHTGIGLPGCDVCDPRKCRRMYRDDDGSLHPCERVTAHGIAIPHVSRNRHGVEVFWDSRTKVDAGDADPPATENIGGVMAVNTVRGMTAVGGGVKAT